MPRGVKPPTKDPAARPAIDRGIAMKLVDALLATLPIDEEQITVDARLVEDLGAEDFDLVELQMRLEHAYHLTSGALDDECFERWTTGTVTDVISDLRRLGVALK